MKLFKKILIFFIVAIVFQGAILLYLDRYYFNYETEIKKTATKSTENAKKTEVVIKVGEKSKNFKVSFDGKYVSYFEAKDLQILDTKTGKANTLKLLEEGTVDYYKWIPEVNKLVFAEKIPAKSGVTIKLYFYDAANNSTEEIKGKNVGNSMAIQEENLKAEVSDIGISSSNNNIYVKITKTGVKYSIYKIDSQASVRNPIITANGIGNIIVTPNEGNLFYEDSINGKIKNSSGQAINIPEVAKPAIIGVDSNNRLYIADVQNGVTKKIYYGIVNSSSNKFEVKELSTSTALKNIYISLQGKIYINDNLMGSVTELTTGVKTEYNGILQSMFDKGLASIQDGKLVNTLFK